ncbi:MAG: hypothetical protein E6Q06_02075 [Candidatus Moraniibacteriota bacterium]|nr:MAG: hypothetical protein E6Q06_02075 [Candidatus Moranbacteria bacterium]
MNATGREQTDHLNATGDYEISTDFLSLSQLSSLSEAKPEEPRLCSGSGGGGSKRASEVNFKITSETFFQSIVWLINYLIVARVARELSRNHQGMGYIVALSMCLFFFTFATALMKRTQDHTFYHGFLFFIFVCIYLK